MGASAIVEAMADLLTCGGMSDLPSGLDEGATDIARLGRGCSTRSDEVGLGGPKWMARSIPNQDVFLHLILWDKTSFVPCRSLMHWVRAKQLAHCGLVFYQL